MSIISTASFFYDETLLQWSTNGLDSSAASMFFDAPVLQYADNSVVKSPVAINYEDPCTQDEDHPWLLLGLQAPPPPPPPPVIVISGVSQDLFGQQGGDELIITASGLIIGYDYQVFINGLPCFGGQGYGYLPQTLDGTTLKVITPILTIAGVLDIVVQQVSPLITSAAFPITIIERVFMGRQFSMRQCFPRWYATGARRIDLEEPL